MLAIELAELQDVDYNLELLGFSKDELNSIFTEEEKEITDDVKIPTCFEVIAECNDEGEQNMIYNILTEKGIKCRLSTL